MPDCFLMTTFDKDKAIASYRKKMESFAPILDEDFQKLSLTLNERQFNKGEVLLKEGQVCKEYYFIISGYIRIFGIEEGREVNVKFFFENDTACDFASFRSGEPSQFYMVAMEETVALCVFKKEVVPVFENGTALHMLLFSFFQQLYLDEELHSNNFKLLSPEERYNFLVENKPEYLKRIPLVYLASYLGVSRETLTRIRQRTT